MIQHNLEKTNQVKKTPSCMGNSEERLHKMYSNRAKSKLGNKIAHFENKLSQLEIKEKPKEMKTVKILLSEGRTIYQNTVIEVSNLNYAFGEKQVLNKLSFSLKTGSKTALIGENGSGKTTLLKAILKNNKNIIKRKNLGIGYFSQQFEALDLNKTVFDSIYPTSILDETSTRRLLANLLFSEEDLNKKVKILSGGEKNKLSIAILLTKDLNLLLLDEPTNHLDISSIEALEKALKSYSGTILFARHDKKLIENIATDIWILEKGHLIINGKSNQQQNKKAREHLKKENEKLLLENRLPTLSSQLATLDSEVDKKDLEVQYGLTLKQLK